MKYFLFVLGFCFSTLPAFAAENDSIRPHIEAAGEGEVEAQPDQARLTFWLETMDKDVKAAQSENARKSKELTAAFKANGVEAKDIQSGMAYAEPRYEYRPQGKRVLTGYAARKNFNVLLRDISSYGPLSQAALAAGVEEFNLAGFESSKRKELELKAYELAVADAKKKAQTIAEALGQIAGKAIFVRQAQHEMPPPMPMFSARAMKAEAMEAQDTLSPGRQTIRVTLLVRFELQ